MAINKELKTSLCYSSLEARNLCERFLSDEAEVSNRSLSAIREKYLINAILPEDKNASYWIQQLYVGDASLSRVMSNVYGYLAAGIDLDASQVNGTKILVQYGQNQLLRMNSTITPNNEDSHYFFGALDSVKRKLIYEWDASKKEKTFNIIESLNQLDKILDWNGNSTDLSWRDSCSFIYMLILRYWDELGNYTYTYRLLSCIASMQTWNDSPAGRLELREVLIKATSDWTYND